jgi:hypothetical protein
LEGVGSIGLPSLQILQLRIEFPFNGVCNLISDDGENLESVAAVTSREEKAR